MVTRLCIIAITIASSISACAQPSARPGDSERDLRAIDEAFQAAIAQRNLDQTVDFYADDAVLLPAAEPMVQGKAAIYEEWKHILAIPDFQNKATLTRVEVSKSEDLAYTMGTYVATMMGEDGKEVLEPGKWLTIWRRQIDGNWRVVVDTYNTDVPPPDHK